MVQVALQWPIIAYLICRFVSISNLSERVQTMPTGHFVFLNSINTKKLRYMTVADSLFCGMLIHDVSNKFHII